MRTYKFEDREFHLHEESFESGCFNKGYIDSPSTCKFIEDFTKDWKENDVFLDIGANTGLMSLFVKKGKVYAFEPTKKTFEMLEENVRLNKINEREIICFNEACYNEEKEYEMEEFTLCGLNKIKFTNQGKKTIVLDKFLAAILEEKRLLLVKIDAEGSDKNIIMGMVIIINKFKPVIITETGGEVLEKMGYILKENIENNSVFEYKNI